MRIPKLEEEKIYQLIMDAMNPTHREQALIELCKKKEHYEDIALILWHTFGINSYLNAKIGFTSILIGEITNVYSVLHTEMFPSRVLTALGLLQCIANHAETRVALLRCKYRCI